MRALENLSDYSFKNILEKSMTGRMGVNQKSIPTVQLSTNGGPGQGVGNGHSLGYGMYESW